MRGAGDDGRLRDQGSSRDKRDEPDEDMAAASTSKYRNGQRGKDAVIDGDDQRRRWCRASRVVGEMLLVVCDRGRLQLNQYMTQSQRSGMEFGAVLSFHCCATRHQCLGSFGDRRRSSRGTLIRFRRQRAESASVCPWRSFWKLRQEFEPLTVAGPQIQRRRLRVIKIFHYG